MQRSRIVFVTAVLMLAATSAWGQVTYKDVLALDFSKTADQDSSKITISGTTKFADKTADPRPAATPVLRLVDGGSQAGTAFLTTSMGLSTYRVLFDMQVQTVTDGDAGPGDGLAFIVQAVGADFLGGGGGSMGYQAGALQPLNGQRDGGFPGFAARFSYAVEFNTWPNNGLTGAADTVALDIMGLRERIAQKAITNGLMNNGVAHVQIDVNPDAITTTITGAKIPAATPFVHTTATAFPWKGYFQDPKGSDGNPQPLFIGWGAGTGGASFVADILNVRVQVPNP